MSRIDIWQGDDELWRWEFQDAAKDVALLSNETYLSRDEAERAARRAYPKATIEFPAGFAFKKKSRGRAAKPAGAIASAVALALVWRAWKGRRSSS